jgi:hypothetical protein
VPRSPDHAILRASLNVTELALNSEKSLSAEQCAIGRQAWSIICRELAKLIDGKPIDREMRLLLRLWINQQRLININQQRLTRLKGRPSRPNRELSIAEDVWEAIWLEPDAKRESIYTYVEQRHGIKRRRLLDILRRNPIPGAI